MIEIALFLLLSLILFLKGVIIDPFSGVFLLISTSAVLYGRRQVVLALETMKLRSEAITDGLTGLYVYRYFELRIKRDLENAMLEKEPISLIIYDIDHFKEINDTYGHEFGNFVLKNAAKIIKGSTRRNDTVARYGGDEFCVLMPGASTENAERCAERAVQSIRRLTFNTADNKKTVNITLSAGIASSEKYTPESSSDFVKAADQALYRSKKEGRDRISIFTP